MTALREIYFLSDVCLLCAYSFVTTEILSNGEEITRRRYHKKSRLDKEKTARVRRLLPTFCTTLSSTVSANDGICRQCQALLEKVRRAEEKIQELQARMVINYAKVLASPMGVIVSKDKQLKPEQQQQQQCDVFPQSSVIPNVWEQSQGLGRLNKNVVHTQLGVGEALDDNQIHLNKVACVVEALDDNYVNKSSEYNLTTVIKTEPVEIEDQQKENKPSGEVTTSSRQCNGPGDITLPQNCTLPSPKSQVADVPVQVCLRNTQNNETQTDFDPSSLIVLDPASVLVLDPSQVSRLSLPTRCSGFDPADIPGFDPTSLPGYDPTREYRAVYVNRNEPVCQERAENEGFPQSSLQQMSEQSTQSLSQSVLSVPGSVLPNIEEVVRFTENIQVARDKVLDALESLESSPCVCPVRLHGFADAMQKMVDSASINVLKMIQQLANTTKQQQNQLLHFVELVQKIRREQCQMEEQFLQFRKADLIVRCSANRKRTLVHVADFRKTKFRKKNQSSNAEHKITFRKKTHRHLKKE